MESVGHIISKDGVVVDPTKLDSVTKWLIPISIKALRGFLGLTCYYRKFIPKCGKIISPLTTLTKNDYFKWTEEATTTFYTLKQPMLSHQVLALPNFNIPFITKSYAFGHKIGAILQQKGRPIAFTNKALSHRNHALYAYEREMLAIIHDMHKWQSYLVGT